MPLPEDFDILFFDESGGRKKSKKTVKLIAVISAVCAAVGRYDSDYPSQCEKAESVNYEKNAYRRNRKAGQKFPYSCRSGCGYGNFAFDLLPKP